MPKKRTTKVKIMGSDGHERTIYETADGRDQRTIPDEEVKPTKIALGPASFEVRTADGRTYRMGPR
jgi:hypothetical protein